MTGIPTAGRRVVPRRRVAVWHARPDRVLRPRFALPPAAGQRDAARRLHGRFWRAFASRRRALRLGRRRHGCAQ
eukprot:3512536-Prymnesium_polylepis.2